MKLSAVATRFCSEQGVTKKQLLSLVRQAEVAFKAQEREHNGGHAADRHVENFETLAKRLGFSVSWPGLWPLLSKNGVTVNLPEMDEIDVGNKTC